VLAEGDCIGPELVELEALGDRTAPARAAEPPALAPPPSATAIWDGLRSSLRAEIEGVLETPDVATRPLGQWITQDLLLLAHHAAGGVLSRAAAILGIPEATYRRQYRKIEGEDRREAVALRTASWPRVRRHLQELVRLGESVEGDRTRRARDVLLEEVLQLVPESAVDGAALMGVSPPTFRRWMRRVSRRDRQLKGQPVAP